MSGSGAVLTAVPYPIANRIRTMTDPAHIVCPHCHTTNRVAEADKAGDPDCGRCHKPLFTAG